MIFRQFLHEEKSCASYLVGCQTLGVTAVIDPQPEPDLYVAAAEQLGLRITDVVDTHVHADHISGARELAQRSGATLRLGAGADIDFDYAALTDGQTLDIGNRHIEVIATPGHTPEHVCLLVDKWFVLTGDTLFVGDVGRVDLSLTDLGEDEIEKRAEQLHDSLQRLLQLEDYIEVYPGHYAGSTCGRGMDGKPVSTIGRERRRNKPLSLPRDEFVAFQRHDTPPLPADFHTIKKTNVGEGS